MKSILITGGTGSFGRAFTTRLLRDGQAERICIYSRGYHAQEQMRREFKDDSRLRFFVGDVRDRPRLTWAMDYCDVVVHAAALKGIRSCYENPDEAVETNIEGSRNVIAAARQTKVEKVVALSTDKACESISIYGDTKKVTESLFLAANHTRGRVGPRFAVTRYGNIWRSAGSIVPTWQQMLEDGEYIVPITDPECTRFFMQMDEGINLVVEALMTMPQKLLIPTELRAFRVGDVAAAMNVQTVTIGLGEYEKCHESMMPGLSSDTVRRMTIEELKAAL